MGFESRDYARTDDRSYASPASRWTVVGWLIAVNVAVYIVQCVWTQPVRDLDFPGADRLEMFVPRYSVLDRWFSLDPAKILQGQLWRLTTYDFLHARENIYHILFNMMVLFYAGRKLLDRYTEREFLWLYLVSGLVSGVAYVGWQLAFREMVPAIGASGAVAAIMVVYAFHWPWDRWVIFFVLPVPAIWVAVGAAIFDLYPMLLKLGGSPVASGVAHVAHIGGMAFGYLYASNAWSLSPWFNWVTTLNPFRRRPRLRVLRDETPERPRGNDRYERQLREQMDAILEKISTQGQASLSADEQSLLNEASRYFRNRG